MKIRIIFNKDTKNKKLCTGWGISFLVNDKILFDTGENGSWLMENIEILKIKSKGLKAALKRRKTQSKFQRIFLLRERWPGSIKANTCPNQAIAVKAGNGISVITGCAYPGIIKMLNAVKENFRKKIFTRLSAGFIL